MPEELAAFSEADTAILGGNDTGPPPIFCSVAKTQQILDYSRVTVYRLIAKGELRAVKSGAKTLVEYTSIKEHAARLPRFVGTTGRKAA